MYVNLVFAAFAIIGGALLVGRQRRTPGGRLDVPGVVAVSGGCSASSTASPTPRPTAGARP
ncbi:hypothetical protein ACFQY7_07840 [Actinomadura luteofluorescens]|uniref:hypothetical protein n=1 Tax=Actinomadura luteofluorescens TaxID=46163 RepID=UPI003634DC35